MLARNGPGILRRRVASRVNTAYEMHRKIVAAPQNAAGGRDRTRFWVENMIIRRRDFLYE